MPQLDTTSMMLSYLLLLLQPILSSAREIQDDWIIPKPPDNSSNFAVGSIISISWSANLWSWFSEYAPTANPLNADLWATPFEHYQLEYLVASNVNVEGSDRVIPCEADFSIEDLANSNYWVFHFVPGGMRPSATNDKISSPGFWVVKDILSVIVVSSTVEITPTISGAAGSPTVITITSTQDTVTITPDYTATTRPTAAIASHLPSNVPSPDPSSLSGLSAGAIAGIATGALFGTSAFLGLAFLIINSKKRHTSASTQQEPDTNETRVYPSTGQGLKERDTTEARGHDSSRRAFYRGFQYYPSGVSELEGRPHELNSLAELENTSVYREMSG